MYQIGREGRLQRKSRPRLFPWLIALIIGPSFLDSVAQSYENLHELKGHRSQVYFSTGAEARATRLAEQVDKVISFYEKQIRFSPDVKLLILSPEDWNAYAKNPVYGMPHYAGNQSLFVASEDNDFWRSFIPPLDKIPDEYAGLVSKTYSDKKGGLTMEPFFDLLAIHELGHAYHIQDSLVMQRKWMAELFANMLLHSYIAENERQLLPALTVFPKMVVATVDRATLKYTTLSELESNYDELGRKYPKNYGWYQCRWHIGAADIYDRGGFSALNDLWTTLKRQKDILNDSSLLNLLSEQVHPGVADLALKWDQ